MPDLKYSRLRREDQHFFLNATEVSGVQSLSVGYETNLRPIKFLGMASNPSAIQGSQVNSVSVSTLAIGADPFIGYTGISGFNGYVLRSKTNITGNFSFTSGYLTSYNSRASIGEIPQTTVGIAVFGNVGSLNRTESAAVSGDLLAIETSVGTSTLNIIGPEGIELVLDDYETNRVLAYDLSINTPRIPVYTLGTKFPIGVEIGWPIEVNCAFQIEGTEYTAHTVKKAYCSPNVKNLTIRLRAYDTKNLVTTYAFTGMYLQAENYSTSVDGNASITAKYRGFISRS